MSRSQKITFVGLVLFLTGLVLTGLYGHFTVFSSVLCIVGVMGGAAVFVPRVTRNLALYANMILYSLFFIASLIVFFRIVQRHPATFDATHDKLYSISRLTQNLLKRLTRPVHVTAFMTEGEKDSASQILREYARYSPQFTYDVINPFREVARARRFGFTIMPGDIFVETVTTSSLGGDSAVKVNKLGEEELTNAIVQALRGKQIILYFLTGHGELPLEQNTANAILAGRRTTMDHLVWLREQLESSHIKVLPLALAQRGKVPADASVVVSVAPRIDLGGAEKAALQTYLDAGGRAIFLLNPDLPQMSTEMRTPLHNVADLLESYGILLPRDVVVMPVQKQAGADFFSVPVLFRKHRITAMENDESLEFTQTRPVVPSRTPPANANVETLLVSPSDSWRMPMDDVARALLSREKMSLSVNPKELAESPLGAAVTVLPPGTPEDRAAKIVVFGNGGFVSTELINQKGWLLFLNSVNWLTNTGDLIAIPAAKIKNTPITLTDGQKQFLFLLLVIIVPSLIGFAGLGYCISRREDK